MSAAERTLLCRNRSMAGRSAVYESSEGVEVDSNEQYETFHRRVLFEDVVLVTFHRETGWGYVLAQAFIAFIFFLIAGSMFAAAAPALATVLVAGLGAPSFVLGILRMITKVDVITVFGRRSKAVLRFPLRRRRAREVYGRICARVRQVQQQIAASEREPEPPTPAAPESFAPPLPPEPALP